MYIAVMMTAKDYPPSEPRTEEAVQIYRIAVTLEASNLIIGYISEQQNKEPSWTLWDSRLSPNISCTASIFKSLSVVTCW